MPENIQQIEKLIEIDDRETLTELLPQSNPSDIAEFLDDMSPEQQAFTIALLDDDLLSDVLVETEQDVQLKLLAQLPIKHQALLIEDMASDDAVDILLDLPEERADEILSELPEDLRLNLKQLLTFDEESAGGIMTSELTALPGHFTVKAARQAIAKAELKDPIMSVYIIEASTGILKGFVNVVQLITADARSTLDEHINDDYIWASVDADQEDIANDFRKYNLWVMPVVDEKHRLVGRITVDDILDVAQEEADEDIGLITGTPDLADEDDSFKHILRLRLPWLIVTMFLALVNSFVINKFIPNKEGYLNTTVMAAFIPVIMAMSGNTGMQSSTIIIRELALGNIKNDELFKIAFKEMSLGASMGLACGILGGLCSWGVLLLTSGLDAQIALLVGISIFHAMIFSSFFSSMVPIALNKMDFDPAVSAGPFVTTLNDIFASIIYFLTFHILLLVHWT